LRVSDVRCSILLIGTELTEGRIRDINGMFIASEMKRRSIPVREIVAVSDDTDILVATIRRLLAQNSIVFLSGGLGPTSDDITRDAVAVAFGVDLVESEACVRHLKSRGIGHAWKANSRQVLIPRGCGVLPNPNGTACGFWGTSGALLVSLPGPPRELQPMFAGQVAGLIAERFHLDSPPEVCFSVFLVSESVLEEALAETGDRRVSWSTRVEEHRIVVTLRGDSFDDLDRVHKALADYFGKQRVAGGETEAAALFADELRSRKMTVVCAESCTGGLTAKLLTEEPGSSDIFWGSFVTYRDNAKQGILGIAEDVLEKEGAVSEAVVSDMCRGALTHSSADIALAVTGYAGPDAPTEGPPVGTVWIAAQMRGMEVQAQCFRFPGGRNRVRRMSAVATILYGKSVLESGGRLDSNENWGYS